DYCGDADTGLRLFQEKGHDLLLLDMNLPGMGGLELTQEIRKLPDGHLPLILLITGGGGERTLGAALDSGVDDYLAKPADPAILNVRLSIAERRIRDAIAQREREEELTRNSLVDPLTGLATRALLKDRVMGGLNRAGREADYLFALLHLDLDAFHRINERDGKEVGDQVLKEVARRVETAIRSLDTPARIAADEFGVFLDDLGDASDITRVTNRIRERFAEPILVEDRSLFVGASMGIAMRDPDHREPEEVFRDAAKALRKAKEQGAGGIRIFDPILHQQASARVEMESRIRAALEGDEMVLHYQPIVALASPRIVGFEALIRWPKADGGFVPAAEFIPFAERSGLVAHVGWWTMEKACRQLVEWHARFPTDPPVAVMVNIPGRQFGEPELVPSVVRILNETGLAPEHLHLEITETSAMTDLERSLATLDALKAVGVHLHVDDFGTGHSSLSYLHQFPVDSLKVDQSFVMGMSERPENLAIIRTVVDLARSLGLSVVAEGIETTDQLAFLREIGCEMGQGWLMSKAVAPREAEAMLRDPSQVLEPLTAQD
ncbi:putative bifunctional diguanylate cyclase/phosphodiesterase, partial [Gemmatimonadota bacterium]